MVDAARFKRLATQRIDSPAANALEISSLSDMVNAARSTPRWWPDATCLTQDDVNGRVWSVKQLADLVQSIASFPVIPPQGFLSFGVVNSRSLLHANTLGASGGHCVALTS